MNVHDSSHQDENAARKDRSKMIPVTVIGTVRFKVTVRVTIWVIVTPMSRHVTSLRQYVIFTVF